MAKTKMANLAKRKTKLFKAEVCARNRPDPDHFEWTPGLCALEITGSER